MNIILLLFLSMLKIGCFAFGGGSDRHTDYMETHQKERVFLYSARCHIIGIAITTASTTSVLGSNEKLAV